MCEILFTWVRATLEGLISRCVRGFPTNACSAVDASAHSVCSEVIESCTVLTKGPNSLVAELHDRMPVIVPPDKYDVWLDPNVNDFEAIRDILKPYDANLMRRYPVNRKLNNSKIDDAESASPVTPDIPTQGQLF